MAPNNRQYWLRFSIRSLFLIVTIAAALLWWVEWNRRVVRERQALLKLPSEKAAYWVPENPDETPNYSDFNAVSQNLIRAAQRAGNASNNAEAYPATQGGQLPWIRRLLGDQLYVLIKTSDAQLVPRIRQCFPEAVCILDKPPPATSN